MDREDHAVDSCRLSTAQQRADVMRILERIQDKDEWRLAPLGGPGEHIGDAREPTGLHDQGDALMAVKAGERRERPTFDLDDRDPQVRRMQDDPLQRLAALGHHEQPSSGPPRDEGFLHGSAAGDELLVRSERVGRRQAGTARRRSEGLIE